MTDEWIAVAAAIGLLERATVPDPARALRTALNLGDVTARGVPAFDHRTEAEGYGEPEPIPAARWATWRFNPERQSLDPPNPRRRIASGFEQVEISRADIEPLAERLAAPNARPGPPARWTGTSAELVDAIKRHFADAGEAGASTNKPGARAALTAELGHIPEKEWDAAYTKAGVRSKGGRPSKTLAKP